MTDKQKNAARALIWLSVVLIEIGFYLWWPPLAFIAGGLFLIFLTMGEIAFIRDKSKQHESTRGAKDREPTRGVEIEPPAPETPFHYFVYPGNDEPTRGPDGSE